MKLPLKGSIIGITVRRCRYHKLPYIVQSAQGSVFYKAIKPELRRNIWMLIVGSNNPTTSSQLLEDLKTNQIEKKVNKIERWISKIN